MVMDVIRCRDKMQQDRRVYRLSRHGVFVGEYKTPEDLAKLVDLAELVEDDADRGSAMRATRPVTGCAGRAAACLALAATGKRPGRGPASPGGQGKDVAETPDPGSDDAALAAEPS